MSFQIRPQLHDQLHEKLRHRPHRVAGIVANVAAGLVAGLVMGAAASTATADVLTTPPAPSASEQANRPTRGMSMEKVEALFGAPVRRQPAVLFGDGRHFPEHGGVRIDVVKIIARRLEKVDLVRRDQRAK